MTQAYVNDIAYKIVGCAIEVHKHIGPGLLESVYEKCLKEELRLNGLNYTSQIEVPISYKGADLAGNLRLDLLVEDIIIVELKSVEGLLPVFSAQLLSYLKLTNKPKGLLINFNSTNIVNHGLIPMVSDTFNSLPK
ncbi:MAG: GxxExxY protein [Bacteroidetes bacterium]|nr:GxxExxY protein [Bacteroidota bacterium]